LSLDWSDIVVALSHVRFAKETWTYSWRFLHECNIIDKPCSLVSELLNRVQHTGDAATRQMQERCRVREDAFFRRVSRERARRKERRNKKEQREKETRREGGGGRYASDKRTAVREARERRMRSKRETDTRTASADRRSVPIATRRDRALAIATFCTRAFLRACVRAPRSYTANSFPDGSLGRGPRARRSSPRLPARVPEGSKVANWETIIDLTPWKRPETSPFHPSVLGETGGTPARFISLRVHMA